MKMTPVEYVNPLIGTNGGLVWPNVQLPNPMVTIHPVTEMNTSNYYFDQSMLYGFSGSCLPRIVCTAGQLDIVPELYAMKLNHAAESAKPYLYHIATDSIDVAVSSSQHGVIFNSTAKNNNENINFLFDFRTTSAEIPTIQCEKQNGYRYYVTVSSENAVKTYYIIEVNSEIIACGVWNEESILPDTTTATGNRIGAYITLKDASSVFKLAVSRKGFDSAETSLKNELVGGIDDIVELSKSKWNAILGRLVFEGGETSQLVRSYTGLYRTFSTPYNFAEFTVDSNLEEEPIYENTGVLWDVFRTSHPMQGLLLPENQQYLLERFMRYNRRYGSIHPEEMIGHHVIAVFSDMLSKNIPGFDFNQAYEALKEVALHSSMKPDTPSSTRDYYNQLGYMPCDVIVESASITLEEAYDDWCMAEIARKLGKDEDAAFFLKRSQNYRNLFDIDEKFIRPRKKNGQFLENFDPGSRAGFTESHAWQYTWYVPHDVQGLINLMGGRQQFTDKLDKVFLEPLSDCLIGVSGIREGGGIGQYVQGNQPDWQMPYLYCFAGQPWKTQSLVKKILDFNYSTQPDGLPGDDDFGSTSCWYVFSALGFYPVCPGSGTYVLGSPAYPKSTIKVAGDKQFIIEAINLSQKNIYIQSATLNDVLYDNCYITDADIQNGSKLVLIMGDKPNKNWAVGKDSVPPSITKSIADISIEKAEILKNKISLGEKTEISIDLNNNGEIGFIQLCISANGKEISTTNCILCAGEKRKVQIPIDFFEAGNYKISVFDEMSGTVKVTNQGSPIKLTLPVDSLYVATGELFMVPVIAKNHGKTTAQLECAAYVDEQKICVQQCHFISGQTKEICFPLRLSEKGKHILNINGVDCCTVYVGESYRKKGLVPFTNNKANFYYNNGEYTIRGEGVDMWLPRDDYSVLYLPRGATEQCEAVVKIDARDDSFANCKVGILIKNDMDKPNQSKGTLTVNLCRDIQLMFDEDGDGACDCADSVGKIQYPIWLKVKKNKSKFTAYYSVDKVTWILVGNAKVPFAEDVQDIGVFMCAMSCEGAAKISFSDFSVKALEEKLVD